MVFIASNLGVWLCLRADPRKIKREKVQNPTSTKIATLEKFLLYGIIIAWYLLSVADMYNNISGDENHLCGVSLRESYKGMECHL